MRVFQSNRRISPLRAWLCAHASSSLAKFQQLEISGFHEPILFQAETPLRKFVAYIDPENKFAIEDKLSQVGTTMVEINLDIEALRCTVVLRISDDTVCNIL